MRVILLTDLHIKPESTPESIMWVKHFCVFMRSNSCRETLVFVLGDVINQGIKSAFDAADLVFSYIERELSTVNYQIFFIPGNHDYCEESLMEFKHFCDLHQSKSVQLFDFSAKKTWNYLSGEINFIITDSVNNSKYNIPGQLDKDGIRECLSPGKRNILLLHHSMVFEDIGTHTGIIDQSSALTFLDECGIQYIFHGHSHATRKFLLKGELFLYGVGSIGLEEKDLEGLINEQEQFLEVSINGKYMEIVKNWMYRGGGEAYAAIQIYPEIDKQYGDCTSVNLKKYDQPMRYIDRYVLTRDLASEDKLTCAFSMDKKVSLLEVCSTNMHILLIADAGSGKSIELKNIAYANSRGNPYMIPILMSLNIYKGQTIQDYINIWAPEYCTLNPEKLLLIMDGYDEIKDVITFKCELKKYILMNPNTHICISMRSNFLSSSTDVFSDFSTYQLLELSQSDIINELKKNNIDYAVFYEESRKKGLTHLLSNPFYLNELICAFLTSATLPMPKDMMEHFIEERISKDSKKYEYVMPSALEECKHEIKIALTRFAYGMQLLDVSSCDENLFQTIIKKEDRQLIKYSSLTIKTSYGHEFSHNIFREYLVAKYISSTSTDTIVELISIPGTKFLNHNWFNILGFVFQLKNDLALMNWIYEAEPLYLTKLEQDCINLDIRFEIFKRTLNEINNRNIWFQKGICTEEDLAIFVQSKRTLELLLEHIESPSHFRLLYFCLEVLSYYTQLYGMDDQVKLILVDCYQKKDVRSHEKCIAITAIARLRLSSSEITADLTERFAESDDSYERLGVYKYLHMTNCVNDYVDFMLSGIEYVSYLHKNSEMSNGLEHFKLIECLESVDSPEAVTKVISWYTHQENMDMNFYNKEKLFSEFFKKATLHYCNGNSTLFDTVYNFFINAIEHYSRQHITDVIRFFSETGTIDCAFQKLMNEVTDERLYIIEDIINEKPDLLDLFSRLYIDDKLYDPKIFEEYAKRWSRTIMVFQKCAEAIKIKTGKIIEPLEPPIDYDKIRRKAIQHFFNALFDKNSARILLHALLQIYENQDLTVEKLMKTHLLRDDYPAGTRQLEMVIIQSGFKNQKVADYFELINWESFFVYSVNYIFNNEEQNNQICISQEQREALFGLYQLLEKKLILHSAFKEMDNNRYSISNDVSIYMTLKKRLSFSSPESYYLGLLELPHFFIYEMKVDEKYNLLEQHVLRKKIEDRIVELISNETRTSVLYDLLYGCKKYRLLAGKSIAIRFCTNTNISTFERQIALEFLYELFEIDVILKDVVPISDESLFEIIISMMKDVGGTMLKSELLNRCSKNRNLFLLKNMIYLNMPEGLEIYIEDSKKIGKPVDFKNGIEEVTEAISNINDKKLISLLLEASRLRFSEGFVDSSFHTLYSSLVKAFRNCAKSEFDIVNTEIKKLKENMRENLDCIGFCSMIEDDILEDNKEKLIKKWSTNEVTNVLQTIV
ncbi:MAG: metallophosphoesterase [Mobilitalea sp.]